MRWTTLKSLSAIYKFIQEELASSPCWDKLSAITRTTRCGAMLVTLERPWPAQLATLTKIIGKDDPRGICLGVNFFYRMLRSRKPELADTYNKTYLKQYADTPTLSTKELLKKATKTPIKKAVKNPIKKATPKAVIKKHIRRKKHATGSKPYHTRLGWRIRKVLHQSPGWDSLTTYERTKRCGAELLREGARWPVLLATLARFIGKSDQDAIRQGMSDFNNELRRAMNFGRYDTSLHTEQITVPGDMDFSTLELARSPAGDLSFDWGIFEKICLINDVDLAYFCSPRDTIAVRYTLDRKINPAIPETADDNIAAVISSWYRAYRKRGGSADPVAEVQFAGMLNETPMRFFSGIEPDLARKFLGMTPAREFRFPGTETYT